MSYVIDVYRREWPSQRNPVNIALYISLFPQLIAGPIVRYHDIAAHLVSRTIDLDGAATGIRRFCIGLAKKVLIANVVGQAADQIFALRSGLLAFDVAWLGLICYTLQIYFGFFRLFGHGDWSRSHFWFSVSRKFQLSLHLAIDN